MTDLYDDTGTAVHDALRSTAGPSEDAATAVVDDPAIERLLALAELVTTPSATDVERLAIEMYLDCEGMAGSRLTAFSELSVGARDRWQAQARAALRHLARPITPKAEQGVDAW